MDQDTSRTRIAYSELISIEKESTMSSGYSLGTDLFSTESDNFPVDDAIKAESLTIDGVDDNISVKRCRKMVVDHDPSNLQYAFAASRRYSDQISIIMEFHATREFGEFYIKLAKNKMDILREIMKCIEALNYIKDGLKRENVSPFSWSPINKQ